MPRPPQSTKDSILSLLRHRSMTVRELCDGLRVTRNAIMVPLGALQDAGLVRPVHVVRTGRKGKPAQSFEIVPEQIEQKSAAYQAIAPLLLETILRQSNHDAEDIMRRLGMELHASLPASPSGAAGLTFALQFLEGHGAEIEVSADYPDQLIISHSCPIGRLVRVDRRICRAMASFLASSSERETVSECSYDEKLTCRFRLKAEAGET